MHPNLITAIDAALGGLPSDVTLSFAGGEARLVDQVVADSLGDLFEGEMRTFETTLLWDGDPIRSNTLSFDLTFGTGTVAITLPEPGATTSGIVAGWVLAGVLRARRDEHRRSG